MSLSNHDSCGAENHSFFAEMLQIMHVTKLAVSVKPVGCAESLNHPQKTTHAVVKAKYCYSSARKGHLAS